MSDEETDDVVWATFMRRTNEPKLLWLEAELARLGIPSRRAGHSFHAPIVEVPALQLDDAAAVLEMPVGELFIGGRVTAVVLDDLPDDHGYFAEYAAQPRPQGWDGNPFATWPDAPHGDWEPGTTPDGHPVQWLNVESRKLSALAYVNDRGYNEDGPPVLFARFKGSGAVYRYLDVAALHWQNLLRAAAGVDKLSVGEYFSRLIEGAHYFEKWGDGDWEQTERGRAQGFRKP